MVGSLGPGGDPVDVTDGTTTVADPDAVTFEQGVTANGDGTATVPDSSIPFEFTTYAEKSAGFTVAADDYADGGNFYLLDASDGAFQVDLENPSDGQGRVGIKLNYQIPDDEVRIYQKTWGYALTNIVNPHDYIIYEWHGFWVAVGGGNAYGQPRTTLARKTLAHTSTSVTPDLQHVNPVDTSSAGGQVTVNIPNVQARTALSVEKADSGGSDVVVKDPNGDEVARLTAQHDYVKLVKASAGWFVDSGGTIPR